MTDRHLDAEVKADLAPVCHKRKSHYAIALIDSVPLASRSLRFAAPAADTAP